MESILSRLFRCYTHFHREFTDLKRVNYAFGLKSRQKFLTWIAWSIKYPFDYSKPMNLISLIHSGRTGMNRLSSTYAWILLGLCVLFPAASLAQIQVMVSIPPQVYVVEQLGGDLVEVTSMLPPGGLPHAYEPTPQQMRRLSRSDMYVRIQVEFEDAWWGKIANINPGMFVVDSIEGIERLENAEDGSAHDPHVWLAPPLVKQQATAICEGLIHVDPEHADSYRAGKRALLQQLDELDREIRDALSDLPSRTFLVFHPSWSYFARAYNLEQLSIEIEGKEPSAAELMQVIKTAQKHNIRVIFVQPQTSRRSAETIARQIGADVAVLDPLAQNWAENLRIVTQALKKALQ